MSQQNILKGSFKFRVVGVALHQNRVLLHRSEKDDFWSLPGGRIELLEPSTETLKRELQEELNIDIKVERLIWIIENFFPSAKGKIIHELALYYLIQFPSHSEIFHKQETFLGYEGDLKLYFKWHLLNSLTTLRLYPCFLKKGLNNIPGGIEHIIENNRLTKHG